MELEPEVIPEQTTDDQELVQATPEDPPPTPEPDVDVEPEGNGIDEGAGDEPADGDLVEDDGEDDEPEEAAEEVGGKLKIFISYNRNANDKVVAERIYEELSQQYEVFLDFRSIAPGDDYQRVTEDALDSADFIIALISAESVETLFIKAELERAYQRYKNTKRPSVIPLRIAYTGPSGLRLEAYTGHFQAVAWDNQDYAWLFEQLRAGLSNQLPPVSKPGIVGTDIIRIEDHLRERYRAAFVEPRELISNPVSFEQDRLLWVTGDATVRNYVAVSLAANTQSKSVYEITRLRKWSEINNTYVSDSTIVLRDALPAPYLNESGAIAEWHSLRAMIERNNIIIATSPDDQFERLTQELLHYHFTDYAHLSVNHNSYTDESKYNIFNLLLDHLFFTTAEIDDDKYAWASDLAKHDENTMVVAGRSRALERRQRESRAKFRENISLWSPADIERFVLSLSRVRSPGDIARLLQRTGAIEDEMRAWFLSLDDSTRCFVLTMAIFSHLSNQELWERYKMIVDHLRQFDHGLRLFPLGICRKRAQPYVSADGPIYLTDERVAEAIRQEVAQSYREYFVELTPKLIEWSTPAGRTPKTIEQRNQRKLQIEETREARVAIARMVGTVGRQGLDDLANILDFWATDPNIHIRRSVALALEQTVKSPTGINHALNLLEKWCHDLGANDEHRWRALAAAIALGNVTVAANDSYVTGRALQYLRSFARSRRSDARFYASIALRQIARQAGLSAIEGILGRLAKDDRIEVRVNVAAALNEAVALNSETGGPFERWLHSTDENRRWIALCGIITGRASQNGQLQSKQQQLLSLLDDLEMAATLASVLGELLTHDHYGHVAKDTLNYLVQESTDRAWENLAAGLGALPLGKLDKEVLPRLRFSQPPLFDERAIDVRREALKKRLEDPARFLSVLKSWLKQETAQLEVFRAFTQLVEESPNSSHTQFVEAMAGSFGKDSVGVSEMLATLEALAPAHFEPLAEKVRSGGFRRALENPPGFVLLAYKQLVSETTANAAREALQDLTRDDESREEMLAALLNANREAPQTVDSLLSAMRATGNADLIGAIHEFNYGLIDDAIATPATLPGLALKMIRSNPDALTLLNFLAAPEPQGKRARLVRSLVEAKLLDVAAVDELFAIPDLKFWPNLASLSAEISRSFYVRRIFSPVTNLFRHRREEAF